MDASILVIWTYAFGTSAIIDAAQFDIWSFSDISALPTCR
jgi:hypothetical protein